MTFEDVQVVHAVDRSGVASHTAVVESLVEGTEAGPLREAIAAYGLEAVAEGFLRTLVGEGTAFADEADARAEAERILASDPDAAPRVHPVTVADLADLFTRIGLTDPP